MALVSHTVIVVIVMVVLPVLWALVLSFQDISLHDVVFSPVLEVNPAIAAACACLFGLLAVNRRRLRFCRQRGT